MIKIPGGRKRETARKVKIEDITSGKFYKEEGFTPNCILTPYGLRVSRSRVLATVVDTYENEDGSYGAITIDDGSDTIRCKFFQDLELMEDVEEGDIVDIVGKVKMYNDELYLVPEIIVNKSPNHELLRLLEYKKFNDQWKEIINKAKSLREEGKSEEDLLNELKAENLSEEDIKAVLKFLDSGGEIQSERNPVRTERGAGQNKSENASEADSNLEKKVLDIIDEKDSGEGADYSEIIENVDAEEEKLEDVINDLLSDGTCYEPRPGKIKKL